MRCKGEKGCLNEIRQKRAQDVELMVGTKVLKAQKKTKVKLPFDPKPYKVIKVERMWRGGSYKEASQEENVRIWVWIWFGYGLLSKFAPLHE